MADDQEQPQQPHQHQQHHQQQPVTLDDSRDQFYVAHRACERFCQLLGAFVKKLQDSKADDPWLTEVQAEAARVVIFHKQQLDQWSRLAENIDEYVDSVRQLADQMAIDELKGQETAEADLSENKAKKIHPELKRFQLEKQARILGKIGGVPALGPSAAALLSKDAARGQILKATASPAAREIHYSKMEDKDAAQLANVFQFRKAASNDETAKADWQQEAKAKNVRRQSEAAAAELKREQEQEEQLIKGGAAELAGVLRSRQQALKSREEEEAAAAASSYRRVEASGNTANAPLPVRELQEAIPELAAKLKLRQAAAAKTQRLLEEEAEEANDTSTVSDTPPWSNTAAPFGGELASVLQKRRQTDEAAAAAAPIKSNTAGPAPGISAAANSELAARLKERASRLSKQSQEEEGNGQQQQT